MSEKIENYTTYEPEQGASITLNAENAAEVLGAATRAVRGGQLSMLRKHPEMDEHIGMVRDKAQEIASRLLDDEQLTAAITVGTKIATQIITDAGQVLDAVITIKVDAKPAKTEE